jgi:hypothetical protein
MVYQHQAPSAIAHEYIQMKHLYKGTAKSFPRKRGQILRPFRPSPTAQPAEQLASRQAARIEMQDIGTKAKENRGKGSYRVSKRETKNLESSLGHYWEM